MKCDYFSLVSTHLNPTRMVFKQFYKRLFSWQSMIALLLLEEIARKCLIKTVLLFSKIAQTCANIFFKFFFATFGCNYTVFTTFDQTILAKSKRRIIDCQQLFLKFHNSIL